MNITYVYIEKGRFWCWVEGFAGLERSFDEEFGTVEWRCLPTNGSRDLTWGLEMEVNDEEVLATRD
jgi:hypothetical protein